MKRAVITGVAGQDGSYLAEYLISLGYQVYGIYRRISTHQELKNLDVIRDHQHLHLIEGDITDSALMFRVMQDVKPNEFYNLAAMSVHPDTFINLRRVGANSYTKPKKIQELWDQYSKIKSIRTETCTAEDGVEVDVEVIDLPDNEDVKILGYKQGMGQWFPLRQISRHRYSGQLIQLKQKWGEVFVTPNHSVYDAMGNLVKPTSNPDLLPMRKLNSDIHPVTEIKLKPGIPVVVNEWGWGHLETVGKSNSSKQMKLKLEYDDETLFSFAGFVGAFVSEGWTSYNQANGSYIVGLCNKSRPWLDRMAELVATFCDAHPTFQLSESGVWSLMYSSKILYATMRKYCGFDSSTKKLPSFVFRLPDNMIRCMLDELWFGDGSQEKRVANPTYRYATTSPILAQQLCLLYTSLGIDYIVDRVSYDDKNWKDKYEIRQVNHYGSNGDKTYSEIDYDGYVYDVAVDEVHNFCAGFGNIVVHNSHVHQSFKEPIATLKVNAEAVLVQLEAIRTFSPRTKFYQASTSELFGGFNCPPDGYTESSRMHPRSPYAVAKLAAYAAVRNYREMKDRVFACNGILFNHSSERRGEDFATRKISRGVASVKLGLESHVYMGNLVACRDEGHAADYVKAMHLMLQQEEPDDYVVATGTAASIEDMFRYVCDVADLKFEDVYREDERFMRPSDVPYLLGKPEKIVELGWSPDHSWQALLTKMYYNDYMELRGSE